LLLGAALPRGHALVNLYKVIWMLNNFKFTFEAAPKKKLQKLKSVPQIVLQPSVWTAPGSNSS
jgi:hypothetical protein